MKRLLIISIVIFAGLLLSACGSESQETAESTPIPTVMAENVIVAEGRIEPILYVDIAFNHPNVKFDVWTPEQKQRMLEVMENY